MLRRRGRYGGAPLCALARAHGGPDCYRERCWYEAMHPRPEGMHSGDTEFVPCGSAGCAKCRDPSTCELCESGTVPKNAADRFFYDRERKRYGRVLSTEARMVRQQVRAPRTGGRMVLNPYPLPQRVEDIRQIIRCLPDLVRRAGGSGWRRPAPG